MRRRGTAASQCGESTTASHSGHIDSTRPARLPVRRQDEKTGSEGDEPDQRSRARTSQVTETIRPARLDSAATATTRSRANATYSSRNIVAIATAGRVPIIGRSFARQVCRPGRSPRVQVREPRAAAARADECPDDDGEISEAEGRAGRHHGEGPPARASTAPNASAVRDEYADDLPRDQDQEKAAGMTVDPATAAAIVRSALRGTARGRRLAQTVSGVIGSQVRQEASPGPR